MSGRQLNNLVHGNIILSEHPDSQINPNGVLVDSESTNNIFCNIDLVKNSQNIINHNILQLYCYGSYIDNTSKGELECFMFGLIQNYLLIYYYLAW